jgi:hypothetical protein
MFCPKCKSEYEPGYTTCSDCRIQLVPELPVVDDERLEYLDYKEILSTNNPGDVALLKSLLDAENIAYSFQGEYASPFVGHAIPIKLYIRKDQVPLTVELLKELKLSFTFGGQNETEEVNEETSVAEPALQTTGVQETALLPVGSGGLESLILRHIEFRYCYYCLVASIGLILISLVLWPMKIIPQGTLQVPQQILSFFLTLYVYLGYVKYSYIESETKFRTIILIVIGLSITESFVSLLAPILNLDKTKSTLYFAIPTIIATPLLFYGFRLIQKTGELLYFRKLSKLNLYLLIIGALYSLFFIPKLGNKVGAFLSMLMLVLAAFVTIASIWYWEIKLFKHLARKYNEIKS